MSIRWFHVPNGLGNGPPHWFGEINGKLRISLECAQGMLWAYQIDGGGLIGPYLGFENVKRVVQRVIDERAYFEQFAGDEPETVTARPVSSGETTQEEHGTPTTTD